MAMSTHVTGFAPPDETWQKMKAIWDACQDAGIKPPEEVEHFFAGRSPDPAGVKVDLPARRWSPSEDMAEGYELDVADIPKNVKTIRFFNAW